MFPSAVYKQRRISLLSSLDDLGTRTGLVLFIGNEESPINYLGNANPFRQDSSWLYFFGIDEPSLIATMDLGDGSTCLFGDETAFEDTIWTGSRPSLKELAASAGINESRPLARIVEFVDNKRSASATIRFLPPYRKETASTLYTLLHIPFDAPLLDMADEDLVRSVIGLREIKDDLEIAELEKAVAVTAQMHKAVIEELRPGWKEYEAAALARYVAESEGCRLSFATIATIRGEILHNHASNRTCEPGGLFLLDAGAEVPSGYAGDLTSTFPVGCRFDTRQAEIYSVLLEVFHTAISSLSGGTLFLDVHLAACLKLAEGLAELGILRGKAEDIVEAGAHALFFPHGLGHMIGLDVHDMEGLGEDEVGYAGIARSSRFGLSSLRFAKKLKPGMVHSIEPGIYFIPSLIEKWRSEKRFREFIRFDELIHWKSCAGMRIEEDWLMTAKGARRLGPALDKSIDAIESARSIP
jgi:Xaa-Pro aminopeptidase